ncbi:hypothetical protein CRYUN_Cryun07bG0184600 [Craigia yunnanensis]
MVEAISKLVALGYDEDVTLKALLRNGHCYGGMDVFDCDSSNGSNSEESEPGFPDLRQFEEYSLAGRASTMEIPTLPSPTSGCSPVSNEVESIGNNGVGVVSPALCRFHGGWGFGNGEAGFFSYSAEMTLQRDIEYPKNFNLSPSMKSLLKKDVAMFAARFRANSKQMQTENQACVGTLSSGDASLAAAGTEFPAEKSESHNLKSQDGVNSVLSKFRDLNIDENLEHVGEDKKGEMIVSLLHQIKDLEK